MNKKAGVFAVIAWMIGVMVIVLFLSGYLYMHNELTNTILNTQVDTNIVNLTDAAQKTIVQVNSAMSALHYISFILIFMLAFAILLENYFIRRHPLLFFVHVIVIILAVVGSVYISNAYEDLMTGNILSSTISGFTASSYVALYLPIWVSVIGVLGIILLMINSNRDPELERRL